MTTQNLFDIAIIGAGPGGYVAAIKAARLGKKVALIEKNWVGGTCLNVGCIPTKTLLSNALILDKIKHAQEFGISVEGVVFDYAKMVARKDSVIEKMRKSLEMLVQSNGITILRGAAEFLSPKELKVKGTDNLVVRSEKIIIASGSEPIDVAAFPCDHKKVFNSTSILNLGALPKSLAIIGGGYIGCEFASLFNELGVKVTILEAMGSIVSLQGKEVSDALTTAFKKRGIEIRTGVTVKELNGESNEVVITLAEGEPLTTEAVLVAVGRKVVSKDLHVERAGIILGSKGEIPVNAKMETEVSGIYAIGDVTAKSMLAHVASHQGAIAALNAAGEEEALMHYNAVPAVIFTLPEIATVGMTLQEALAAGFPATTAKFPFKAIGKAVAAQEDDGFAQVVVDLKTRQILGAQIVGSEASVMIGEIALAIANELTVDCVSETIHAHPTLSEVWPEAALLAVGDPLHLPPPRKK